MLNGHTAQRLLALLRLLEQPGTSIDADDALLDTWFGPQSTIFPADSY